MTTERILIVDDEPDLSELLAYNLERAGYSTRVEHNGVRALESLRSFRPDLLILDIMMPELNGIEVAERMKRDQNLAHIPIIMLTARTGENDELNGLAIGADDYVTKPFSMKVLEARIQTVLRRLDGPNAAPAIGSVMVAGRLRLDRSTHEVHLGDEEIQLTHTEFRLLESLMQAGGKVLSRQSLISEAIGPGVAVTERTIDVHITSLRKKLDADAGLIKTVRGVGYRIAADVSTPETV